jgi:3-oxoadipate CoA-transferase, beta subunit
VSVLGREQMAWRAAQDLPDGGYVNLGIGMPVLASNHAPPGREIMFHSENGLLGVGPEAEGEAVDPDLVDAGSRRVTLRRGAAVVDSAEAFAMIRGGHIDITLLGGYEVSASGDLANWDMRSPGKGQLVGGAMDLAVGARSVWVIMAHVTRGGEPRLVESCSLPLTGIGVVDRIYTDRAVIDVTADGFLVREIVKGLDAKALQALTGAPLAFAADYKVLTTPTL